MPKSRSPWVGKERTRSAKSSPRAPCDKSTWRARCAPRSAEPTTTATQLGRARSAQPHRPGAKLVRKTLAHPVRSRRRFQIAAGFVARQRRAAITFGARLKGEAVTMASLSGDLGDAHASGHLALAGAWRLVSVADAEPLARQAEAFPQLANERNERAVHALVAP